jgi:Beta-propeller repeat
MRASLPKAVFEWLKLARYNGPGNYTDDPVAIAVDGSGNIYVTGESSGQGGPMGYATIKYNSVGEEQWVVRYNGPGNGNDRANAITVDASENVYVTGKALGQGTGIDYATIKYNSAGQQQWVARYNGPASSDDYATAIAIDGSGNVYATGTSSIDAGSNLDYLTIKYNSAGQEQWVASYNRPGNALDFPYGIAVDSSGNVYVTGESDGLDSARDYATIKYNSTGQEQWVARYNGPANYDDEARAIVLDGSANVYVTGYSYGVGDVGIDYATIKYNSAGQQQWVARYNGGQGQMTTLRALPLTAPEMFT